MSIEGPFLIRVPKDTYDIPRGYAVFPLFTDVHDNSLRFVRSQHGVSGLIHASARYVARIAWQVNAMERWLGMSVTTFEMRDRITHAKYALNTLPFPWVPESGGDPWRDVILNITDQLLTGGPSQVGCSRFYMHEFFATARAAWLNLQSNLWAAPPDGPGVRGAIYGAKWAAIISTPSGNLNVSGTPCLGGGYPPTPQTLGLNWVDSRSWDFAVGPHPLDRDFYLPTDQLRPLNDWSTNYFERLRYRKGTTVNANHWPADQQVIADFGARPYEMLFTTKASSDTQLRGAESLVDNFRLTLLGSATDTTPAPGWQYRVMGFDPAVSGPVWNLSLWEWICLRLGYVPRRVHAVGSFGVSVLKYTVPPTAEGTSHSTFSMKCSLLGVQLGQELEGEVELEVPPAGSFTENFAQGFDVDVSMPLRNSQSAHISVEYDPAFAMLEGHHHEHSFDCDLEFRPMN